MDKNTVAVALGLGILVLTAYALSLGIDGVLFASALASVCTIASWVMGVEYGKKGFTQEQTIQEADEEGEA